MVSETSLYENDRVVPTIRKLKAAGYTYEEEGALWFKSTEFGDDKDRVLIKSDGSYTYLTPDIAYHLNKLDRGYEYLVDLLGADHHGYINRMKAAIQALGYNADQLNIDIIQMVRMMNNGEPVKMSKRTGNAVTIKDLIEEIGVDATRYSLFLKLLIHHLILILDLLNQSLMKIQFIMLNTLMLECVRLKHRLLKQTLIIVISMIY